jgi:hypothetical protein
MKRHINIKNGIIVILTILLFLVILNPGGHLPNRNIEVLRIDSIPFTIHDTIIVDSIIEVPVEIMVENEKLVPMYQPVDTAEILKIYFNRNVQKNILTLPNNIGTITITDTISQNKIVGRSFESKVKKQIVRDTIRLPEVKKNKVYVGFTTQMDNVNLVNGIGVGLLLQTKKDKIYNAGIGVNNRVLDGTTNGSFFPYVNIGVFWKIKIKK